MSDFLLDLDDVIDEYIILYEGTMVEGFIDSYQFHSNIAASGYPWIRIDFRCKITTNSILEQLKRDEVSFLYKLFVPVEKDTFKISTNNVELGVLNKNFSLSSVQEEFMEGVAELTDPFDQSKMFMENLASYMEGKDIEMEIGVREWEERLSNTIKCIRPSN